MIYFLRLVSSGTICAAVKSEIHTSMQSVIIDLTTRAVDFVGGRNLRYTTGERRQEKKQGWELRDYLAGLLHKASPGCRDKSSQNHSK